MFWFLDLTTRLGATQYKLNINTALDYYCRPKNVRSFGIFWNFYYDRIKLKKAK